MSAAKITEELSSQITELLASYELAADRMRAREKEVEQRLTNADQFLNEQLEKVNALMADLRETMTEAGAARSRLAAKEALKLGEAQIETLRKMTNETNQTLRESCERFDRTVNTSAKNIQEAVNAFNIDEFKSYAEKSCVEIKDTAAIAMDKVTDVLKWFHWKNITLATGLSLMVAVCMGLYINDEWPWEMHGNVVKQRTAGQALMTAWPALNKTDQNYLEQNILKLSKNQ